MIDFTINDLFTRHFWIIYFDLLQKFPAPVYPIVACQGHMIKFSLYAERSPLN